MVREDGRGGAFREWASADAAPSHSRSLRGLLGRKGLDFPNVNDEHLDSCVSGPRRMAAASVPGARAVSSPSLRLLVALFVAMTSAAPAAAALRPVYGGSARIAAEGPLRTHDPALASTGAERLLAVAAHCTLADVVAWTEPAGDGKVRLRLFENLVFHDGTRLSASDVKRSLRRAFAMEGSVAAWRLLAVAPDSSGEPAMTVKSTTSLELEPISGELDPLVWLDDPGLAIVKEDGLTGCGPFRPLPSPEIPPALRADPDDVEITLAPFDRHPRGRPFLDRLEIVVSRTGAHSPALDGALGPIAQLPGATSSPDRRVVSLRLSGSGSGDEGLRRRVSAAMDRDVMARLLVGSKARPLEHLAKLLAPGAVRTTAEGAQPTASGSLPDRLMIAYEAGSPNQRRLAERVQLRLHDEGVRARLSRADRIDEDELLGWTIARIDVHEDLPGCPIMRASAVAHRHGGSEIARRTLLAALRPEGAGGSLLELAASLESELGLVLLAGGPDRAWLADHLHAASGTLAEGLDPAELWRLPEDVLAPASDGSGGL